jgi:hypothetical protein
MYYVADLMLVAAMLFFVFLPITDRKTVMMKIGMIGVIAALFAVAVTKAHGPELTADLPQSVVISSN